MNRPAPSHPAGPIETSVQGGIVRTVIRGIVEWGVSSQALAGAVALAESTGNTRLLFDLREATHLDFHNLVLRHAEGAPELARRGLRIAVLGRAGDGMLKFIDDVAANRALHAKTFTAEDAARAWLEAGTRPQ
jgi:hypothetical protein